MFHQGCFHSRINSMHFFERSQLYSGYPSHDSCLYPHRSIKRALLYVNAQVQWALLLDCNHLAAMHRLQTSLVAIRCMRYRVGNIPMMAIIGFHVFMWIRRCASYDASALRRGIPLRAVMVSNISRHCERCHSSRTRRRTGG